MFKQIFCDLLKINGMTQSQLAKQADIPLTTISGWINANRLPDYNAIKKLAQFFDVSTDYLLGLTDEWGNAQPSSGSSSTGTTKPPSELSEDERNLLQQYKTLSPQRKREVTVWIQTLNEIDNQTTNLNKNRKTS